MAYDVFRARPSIGSETGTIPGTSIFFPSEEFAPWSSRHMLRPPGTLIERHIGCVHGRDPGVRCFVPQPGHDLDFWQGRCCGCSCRMRLGGLLLRGAESLIRLLITTSLT